MEKSKKKNTIAKAPQLLTVEFSFFILRFMQQILFAQISRQKKFST